MKTKFTIRKKSPIEKNFKTDFVKSKFDLQMNEISEIFEGELKITKPWNVGCIIGASGTGKSTIAREIFDHIQEPKFGPRAVIEEFEGKTVNEVAEIFNKVGFSSPPSWLKPFSVLSNGEKMRVELAKAILSPEEIIVFDEFTSVVDRNVAQIGSYATAKYIRKAEKQFVAITCHYDIIDWLEPDWIFDTNTMTFIEDPKKKDQISKSPSIDASVLFGPALGNITI